MRKRIKKQQEKQLKREAYEAMERQKKMMAEETDKDLKGQFPSFCREDVFTPTGHSSRKRHLTVFQTDKPLALSSVPNWRKFLDGFGQ